MEILATDLLSLRYDNPKNSFRSSHIIPIFFIFFPFFFSTLSFSCPHFIFRGSMQARYQADANATTILRGATKQ